MNKTEIISNIKRILNEWGSTSSEVMNLDKSPLISSEGNTTILADRFYSDHVTGNKIINGSIVDYIDYQYEDLDDNLLDEIHNIIEGYDVEMNKTMENYRDENF